MLRGVARSSALALALLGLGAEPARAKASVWGGEGAGSFPISILSDLGSYRGPAPVWGDLDGDGDLDLVMANGASFLYFENTGSATSPNLVERTGTANPLPSPPTPYESRLALVDLDTDGDLDLVTSDLTGDFFYFENTGSATSASFVLRTGAQNPFGGLPGFFYPNFAFADLDRDGDLDLTVGGTYELRYFENTGTAVQAAFIERTGAARPFFEVPGGADNMLPAPSFGDLDGDGDLDLVVGRYVGFDGLRYFENTGSATQPALVERTGASNPLEVPNLAGRYWTKPALADVDGDGDLDLLSGSREFYNAPPLVYLENRAGRFVPHYDPTLYPIDVGSDSRPAFGDLDGDGDLDIVVGESGGGFAYFENTGGAAHPAYVQRTGTRNPLDGHSAGPDAAPVLADLDGDGDLDLVAGASDGRFTWFENTGSAQSPAFAAGAVATGPLAGLDVGNASTPSLGDLDGDGDLDLVSGESGGTLHYFENTGGAASPAFIERTGAQNPFDGLNAGATGSAPSLGDFDGDGDLDLVVGADTACAYFENTGSRTSPAFIARTGSTNPMAGEVVAGHASPTQGDYDGDGDADVLAGAVDGKLSLFVNAIVRPSRISVFELSGGANPLAGRDVGSSSAPALGDLDHDGDLDLVAGAGDGSFAYLKNTGDATHPVFASQSGVANPFEGLGVGLESKPALGDLDGDGDLDLVAGNASGTFGYFENTGTAIAPAFAPRTGTANPLDGVDVGDLSTPALVDLDGDGDLDLVAGNEGGGFAYFENTGSATNAAFVVQTGAANPLGGANVGGDSVPAFRDVDGDGDLDLVAGNASGALVYFENTGSATSPAFVQRTGGENPFGAWDVGDASAPALADLDADGDPDLVAGLATGAFRTFYLPEPGHGLLLGAGLSLLSWLGHLRGRRSRR